MTPEQQAVIDRMKARAGQTAPTPTISPVQQRPMTPEQLAVIERMKTRAGVAPVTPEPKGMLDTIGEERGTKVIESIRAGQRGEQGLLETGAQIGGQVFGGASDVLFGTALKTAKFLAPKPLEELTAKGVQKIATSAPVQSAMQSYEKYLPEGTRARRNVSAGLGALSFAGDLAGISAAPKVASAASRATKTVTQPVKTAIKTKVVEPIIQSRVPKAVKELEDTYYEIALNRPKAGKLLDKAKAKTEIQNNFGLTTGENPVEFLSKSGIIPKQSGTRLTTTDQANQVREGAAKLKETARESIAVADTRVPPISFDELQRRALQLADTPQNRASGKYAQMVKEIQDEMATYRSEFGYNANEIPLSALDDIKVARWADTKFDSTKPLKSDVNYNIAKASHKIIEENAMKAGLEDLAQLNRTIGDRLEAARFLDKINDFTVKRGRLGKLILSLAGTQLSTNPIGRILGYIGGDAVGQLLIDNAIAGPLKRSILKGIQTQDPEAYKKVLQYLNNRYKGDIKWLTETKALPPPSRVIVPEATKPAFFEMNRNYQPTVLTPEIRPGQLALPQQTVPQPQRPLVTPFTMMEQGVPVKQVKSGAYSSNLQRRLTPERVVEGKVVPKGKASVPQNSLINEAKKYKNAEEFVKAQGEPVYHAGVEDFNPNKIKKSGKGIGFYTTKNKDYADTFLSESTGFGGKKPIEGAKTNTFFISPDANVLTKKDIPSNLKWDFDGGTLTDLQDLKKLGGPQGLQDRIAQFAIKKGYDMVDLDGQQIILNGDKIKTKSQLEQIWKEANKQKLPKKK